MGKKKAKKLSARELQKYKELLLEKRRETLADVNCIEENIFQGGGELSTIPVHMADIGTDSYEQEFSLGLMEEGKKNLVEIHQALKRINGGKSGATPREHAIGPVKKPARGTHHRLRHQNSGTRKLTDIGMPTATDWRHQLSSSG